MEIKKVNELCFDETTKNILKELEKTRTDFWNLDRQSANFLNTLIKINNSKNVLEIGTSNGYSGVWILKALKETNGKLTTIEFWEKRQSVARANFKTCCPDVIVEPKIGSAIVILEDLLDEIQKGKREKFDFIFIDANKKEYISYFNLIDKMIAEKGVILADNILSHYEKVQDYVENLFNREDYQSQILDLGAGMMLSRKD
ncbi:O-methyltransferase [bacterium]|nr:O-methyltransferase [bacterium]